MIVMENICAKKRIVHEKNENVRTTKTNLCRQANAAELLSTLMALMQQKTDLFSK